MQVNGTLVADAGSAQVTLHRTVSVVTLRDSARSTRALRSEDIGAVQFYHKGMADTGHIEMTRLSQSHFVYTQMFALCRVLENKSPEGWKPRGAAGGVYFSFNLLFEVLLLLSRKFSAPLCFC